MPGRLTELGSDAESEAVDAVLLLDMSDIERITSEGLNELTGFNSEARSQGVSVQLLDVCNTVRDVFKVTRLERMFEWNDRIRRLSVVGPGVQLSPNPASFGNARADHGHMKQCGLELLQKAKIAAVQIPNVGNSVSSHAETLDAESECETAVNFGVVAHRLKYGGIDHASSPKFDP